MDRPKHRRFLLLGFALLACGLALLLGWQWRSASVEPAHPVAAQPQTRQLVDPEPAPVEPTPLAAAAPSTPTTASSPAATGAGLRGRVVDAVTRRPLKEFEVRMTRLLRTQESSRYEEPITRTFRSETGRFAWNDLAAGTWDGAVSASGYQQFNLGELTLVAGKSTRETVMPMLRGFAIRGRVFERGTGAGIVDAWITFRESGSWIGQDRGRAYAKSQEDGVFVLDGVPGGEIVLSVGAQDHAHHEIEILVDDKTPPQEIALSAGSTVAGVVLAASGAPVQGSIMLSGPGPGYGDAIRDGGRFAFKHMRAGRYSLYASTQAGSAMQEIVLGQDEVKNDIVLTVGAGRSVRGTVRGLKPEHLERTYISLHSESNSGFFSARPDQQGSYAVNGVPPGAARLSVHGGGRRYSKKLDVPANQDLVFDIVFPPGARLSGRVTQDTKPLANKFVFVGPADGQSGLQYQVRTSEDGQYEIEGLPPGDYRLRAHEDVSRSVSIAGDTVLNIEIPSVQLGGRVLEDGSTVPIVGADVYLRGSEAATARVRGHRDTDDYGQFKLTGIEPGDILLTVFQPGYELYREKISYGAPITNKTVSLRKERGVELRVRRAPSSEQGRGVMVSEAIPGIERGIDLWIPLDREGIGYLPSGLAGSSLTFYGAGEKQIVVTEWDGQSLELKL